MTFLVCEAVQQLFNNTNKCMGVLNHPWFFQLLPTVGLGRTPHVCSVLVQRPFRVCSTRSSYPEADLRRDLLASDRSGAV